eukprot:CAMPEP_0183739144 /NCGR_PEP_ID=MMETSP0737-20130205/56325_1 /TAXON_ID=385413 /ORGANISM="Thalassiosira miniscula, Strain CCMP1093" /LENGTH=159 /DNA_ID=CAMNT_0025973869 /DNA_START=26 /DNA_END=501 /DNA_ORIENTATION=+
MAVGLPKGQMAIKKSGWIIFCVLCLCGGGFIFEEAVLLITGVMDTVESHPSELSSSPSLASAEGNTTNIATQGSALGLKLPTRNASVAIILAGDVRTFICPVASEKLNHAILEPLQNANFTVHVFAYLKPTVYYGAKSPWVLRFPQCANNLSTPFMNVS